LKKLIAISMLIILLFNIGGQLAFHEYLVYQSDKFFNDQISKHHYNIDDLAEIRIPVNIPCMPQQEGYENISGRVQFGSTAYNYVKIKMTRDTMYLMCIPNYATTQLSSQNIIYVKQIPDIPVPKKEHVPFGKINLMVCNYQAENYKFLTPVITTTNNFTGNQFYIPASSISGPCQPPDAKANLS
jgi:hypothetical protein